MAAMMFQEAREVAQFVGLKLMKCEYCFEDCCRAQGVKFEELKVERNYLEDKLGEAEFEIGELKE